MRELLTCRDLPGDSRAFLAERVRRCRKQIEAAARRAGREPEEIQLVAVTKYVDTDVLRLLYELGVKDFGESRVQTLEQKSREVQDLPDVRLHMIGHLQRNKVQKALKHAAAIHSVDSLRILNEISSRLTQAEITAPDVYFEVNISREAQRTGGAIEELPAMLKGARDQPVLADRVRGLMAMAPYSDDPEDSRPYFRQLRQLRNELQGQGLLPEDAGLSMGMSSDFNVAIEEGATIVRVGTMLFYEES